MFAASRKALRKLIRSGLVAALVVVAQPSTAQNINEGLIRADGAEGGEVGCMITVSGGAGGSMDRRTFQIPQCHSFSFAVIEGENLSAATIDARVEAAANIIRADTQVGDFACLVGLRRTGAVTTFAQPAGMSGGIIENEADQNAVLAIDADVKIVSSIHFCDQPGSYVGCRKPGGIILTTGFHSNIFAHEIGHQQTLCHVGTNCVPECGQQGACSGCEDPSASNIMWYRSCEDVDQHVLNASQCSDFLP